MPRITLAYRIELLIQRKRRSVSRRVVEGGCVVLEPERFKRKVFDEPAAKQQ
jgi:hypothetical protein